MAEDWRDKPITTAELDLIETMAQAVIDVKPNPNGLIPLVQDEAGYFWSKERNALNHLMSPAMCIQLARHLRRLR